MKQGGTFGHVGKFCTFETLLTAFDLQDATSGRLEKLSTKSICVMGYTRIKKLLDWT